MTGAYYTEIFLDKPARLVYIGNITNPAKLTGAEPEAQKYEKAVTMRSRHYRLKERAAVRLEADAERLS